MKKYKLVKSALALTMSLVLLTQVTGCNNKTKEDINSSIKIENENDEPLVVISLIDRESKTPIGDEKYGYIDSDLIFHSAISDYTMNLFVSSNTNCDIYYTNYINCLDEDAYDKVITSNEVSLEEIKAFESSAYVLSKRESIKIIDGNKETRMNKFDSNSYFKDTDETTHVLSMTK